METTRFIVACMVAVALVLACLTAYEAIYVGVVASADEISQYHFGSEAMVGEGGLAYKSRKAYVGFSALCSVLFLTASVTGVRFVRKGGLMWSVLSVVCFLVGLFFVYGV